VNAKEIYIVDDDYFVGKAWELAAQSLGINPFIFKGYGDFLKIVDSLNLNSIIVSDNDLGERISGIERLKDLKEAGFMNLFLSSGAEHKNINPKIHLIPKDPWEAIQIISKMISSPP